MDRVRFPRTGMLGRSLDRSVLAGVALVVFLLVLNAVLGYRNTHQLSEDASWVAHTHEVLESLDDLLFAVRDAETGRRRLLSGRDKEIKPYEDELIVLNAKLARLRQLVVDNDHQQAPIGRLRTLVQARWDELARTIAARKGPRSLPTNTA